MRTCYVIMPIGDQEFGDLKISKADLRRRYDDLIAEAIRKADPSMEIIPEAILATILFAIWIPVWELPENVRTWVSLPGLVALIILILWRRFIAPFFRKILGKEGRR